MLENNEWEKLNGLIDIIYREKNFKSMRKKFLKKLYDILPSNLSTFKLIRRDRKYINKLVDAVVFSEYTKEFEDDFISKYENVYGEVDYAKWIFNEKDSLVYRETDLIKDSARKNNLFYREYLKPSGLIYVSGISLIKNEKRLGSIALYRTSKAGDFSNKDMYILEQIFTHLQNRLSEIADELNSNNSPYILKSKYKITEREADIIKKIFDGKTNAEIAECLYISENTVKKHISSIFSKCNISNRAKLIRLIFDLGIETSFS